MNKKKINEKDRQYHEWIAENEINKKAEALEYQPLFSVFLFTEGGDAKRRNLCKKSIRSQSYRKWEVIEASREEGAELWQKVHGDYILFLSEDAMMAKNALWEMAHMMNGTKEYDMIYSDEDQVRLNGRMRFQPFFKPDWSPDLFWCMNYVNQLTVYRRTLAEQAWNNMEGKGAYLLENWIYGFQMYFEEYTEVSKIGHIPKILYHTRERSQNGQEKNTVWEEQQREVKQEALQRRKLQGHLEPIGKIPGTRVVYECTGQPLISIIIPSKDNVHMLQQCLSSIEEKSTYRNYEIILVDNGSSEENRARMEAYIVGKPIKYKYERMEFNFSRMCNIGVKAARGKFLLFLNDDIEILQKDWLERLAGHGMQRMCGAVGAKLLYPNSNRIQHVGVANLKIGPVHYLTGQPDSQSYYFGRNCLDYNCIAVTGACLLVSRDKFREVGGFDEGLPVSFNDVDLCFKLYEAGYYNVVRNDVCLYHHESASRGQDAFDSKKIERSIQERRMLWDRHRKLAGKDPFYNDNLVQDKTDFRVKLHGSSLEINESVKAPHNLDQIQETFSVYIDRIVMEETIWIEGWYYWRSDEWTERSRAYLILKDGNGKCIGYHTCSQVREDVAKVLQNQVVDCGFSCRIPYQDLKLGEMSYQIGVMVEISLLRRKRIQWTEHRIQ